MSDYQLGKKVAPPPPVPKADVIEKVGDVWTVNGKFQTNPPERPQSKDYDPFKHLREVLEKQREQQAIDGLDVIYMGWM